MVKTAPASFFESGQELLEKAAIMFGERTFDPLQQRTAGQTKARHQFDDGKTTAGFLSQRLRPDLLLGGVVGHGNARAIHQFDAPAQPEFGGAEACGKFAGQCVMQFRQIRERQTIAGLAIGARAAVGRLVLRRIPSLDFANHLAAGRTRTQDLAQERPKSQGQRIGAAAAVEPLGRG